MSCYILTLDLNSTGSYQLYPDGVISIAFPTESAAEDYKDLLESIGYTCFDISYVLDLEYSESEEKRQLIEDLGLPPIERCFEAEEEEGSY